MNYNHNNKSIPVVSVCTTTFNNAPYTRECIEGILMQKTNFPFELIINDDCSTDGTTEILREYEAKYPDIVKPVYHDENLYSKGITDVYNIFCFSKAKGKYIACCDGDDYWIDPLKLQKQYDIMEANPQYSLCHHNYKILCDGEIRESHKASPKIMGLEEAADCGNIQSSSMFFRNYGIGLVPKEISFPHIVYQFFWALRLAEFGDIYYIDEPMDMYRVHDGGLYSGSSQKKRIDMALGNIENMIMWYKYKKMPNIVKILKSRGRRSANRFARKSIRNFNIKELFYLACWYSKFI